MKDNDNTDIAMEETSAISLANQQRAITEVQASISIAKQFPRDEEKARQRILNACGRPALAERATYSYARGGTDISDASIRLAEEIARQWGNIDYGWRVLDSKPGSSQVEAYSWDKETNTRQSRQFWVSHTRVTKQRTYQLTDPRDIYEKQANEAARRMRACIMASIPRDIIDEAVEQCAKTVATKIKLTPEKIQKMIDAFALLGVSAQQIEKRIQRKLDAMKPAQFVQICNIYNSIKEGMSNPESWFEMDSEKPTKKGVDAVKERLAEKANPETGELPLDEPPDDQPLPE